MCYEKTITVTAMDKKETLGAYLRKEREAREIKLAAISKATKISLPFLAALEADEYDALPDKKAIPDYLKGYCRYLLMDAQEARKRFELQHVRRCSPEGIAAACLPEIIDDLEPPEFPEPPPVVAPSHVLPPTIVSSGQETGFFNKYRLFFVSMGVLVVMFVIFSGLLFYFHPLRDRAAKTAGIKAEAPPAAVKSPPPAVREEKVIGNRDSRRYHLLGMKYYDAVKAFHRVEFDSEGAAINAGYQKAPR